MPIATCCNRDVKTSNVLNRDWMQWDLNMVTSLLTNINAWHLSVCIAFLITTTSYCVHLIKYILKSFYSGIKKNSVRGSVFPFMPIQIHIGIQLLVECERLHVQCACFPWHTWSSSRESGGGRHAESFVLLRRVWGTGERLRNLFQLEVNWHSVSQSLSNVSYG